MPVEEPQSSGSASHEGEVDLLKGRIGIRVIHHAPGHLTAAAAAAAGIAKRTKISGGIIILAPHVEAPTGKIGTPYGYSVLLLFITSLCLFMGDVAPTVISI